MSDQCDNVDNSITRDRHWRPPELNHSNSRSDAEASAVVDRLRQEAFDQGYAEGLSAGGAEAQEIVANMNALLNAIKAPLHESVSVVLDEILVLVEKAVEAVLERELEMSGAELAQIVRRSLEALGETNAPTILTLHPTDADCCRQLGLMEDQTIVLVEDCTLHRGGVKIRAGSRFVDASVEKRLHEVLTNLREHTELHTKADMPTAPFDARSDGKSNPLGS